MKYLTNFSKLFKDNFLISLKAYQKNTTTIRGDLIKAVCLTSIISSCYAAPQDCLTNFPNGNNPVSAKILRATLNCLIDNGGGSSQSNSTGASAGNLNAADWDALCTTGSITDANGCFGTPSGTAWNKISAAAGVKASVNIDLSSPPANSLWLKKYTTPGSTADIEVSTNGQPAKCLWFIQSGYDIHDNVINNSIDNDEADTSSGRVTSTDGTAIISQQVAIEDTTSPSGGPLLSPLAEPIIVFCIAQTSLSQTTPTAFTGAVTSTWP